MVTEVVDLQDKREGKNAIVVLASCGANLELATLIAETLTTLVIRGWTGFGGVPGQRLAALEVPDREPDVRIVLPTREALPAFR